jgi:hypothetical protein
VRDGMWRKGQSITTEAAVKSTASSPTIGDVDAKEADVDVRC